MPYFKPEQFDEGREDARPGLFSPEQFEVPTRRGKGALFSPEQFQSAVPTWDTREPAEEVNLKIFPSPGEAVEDMASGVEISILRTRHANLSTKLQLYLDTGAGPFGEIVSPTEALDVTNELVEIESRLSKLRDSSPDSLVGGFLESISRFFSYYITLAVGARAVGAKMGPMSRGLILAPGAGIMAFDVDEPRLSNLIESAQSQWGVNLSNPVTQYLQADPDDPQSLKLFKQSVEEILLSGVGEAAARTVLLTYYGARSLKARRVVQSEDTLPSHLTKLENADVEASDIMVAIVDEDAAIRLQPLEEQPVRADVRESEIVQAINKFRDALKSAGVELSPEDLAAKEGMLRSILEGHTTLQRAPKGEGVGAAVIRNMEGMLVREEAIRAAERSALSRMRRLRDVLTRSLLDPSGNIKRELVNEGGHEGQDVSMMIDLSRGASTASRTAFRAADREIFAGLTRSEERVLSELITLRRDMQILVRDPEFKGLPIRTPKEGQQALEALRQKYGSAIYAKVNDRATKYFVEYRKIIDTFLEEGIVSPKEAVKLKRFAYSPLEFIEEMDPIIATSGRGPRTISVRSSGIKPLAEGLSRSARSQLNVDYSSLLRDAIQRAHGRVYRNRMNRELYDFATNNPENSIIRLNVGRQERPDYTEIAVMIDGQPKVMYLDRYFMDEWTMAPAPNMPQWLRAISGQALVRPLATGINPFIAPILMLYDLQFSALVAGTTLGPGARGIYHWNRGVSLLQQASDLKATARDAFTRTGRFDRYLSQGGGMSLMSLQGRLFSEAHSRALRDFEHYAGWLNETAEIWVRLAVRERALKQGFGELEATAIARGYLDHAMKGGMAGQFDQISPYFNVAVQSWKNVFNAVGRDPKRMAAKLASIGGIYAGFSAYNIYTDPEGWAQVSPNEKANNVIIMMPFLNKFDREGNLRHAYVRIPIDYTMRPVKAGIEALLQHLRGDGEPSEQLLAGARSLTDVIPGATGVVPSVSALVAYATNHDLFTGEPIYRGPRVRPGLEFTPFNESFSTHPLAVDMLGPLDISPARGQVALGKVVPSGNPFTTAIGGVYTLLARDISPEDKEALAIALSKQAPINRVLRFTHPSTPYVEDLEEVIVGENSRRQPIINELNRLSLSFHRGYTSLEDVKEYIKSLEKMDQDWAFSMFENDIEIRKVFSELGPVPFLPSMNNFRAASNMLPTAKANWLAGVIADAVDGGNVEEIRAVRKIVKSVPGFNVRNTQFGAALAEELERLGVDF